MHTQPYGPKIYNTKFVVTNMTKIVTNDNQLHSDWLQMTRFLVVINNYIKAIIKVKLGESGHLTRSY